MDNQDEHVDPSLEFVENENTVFDGLRHKVNIAMETSRKLKYFLITNTSVVDELHVNPMFFPHVTAKMV